VARQLLQGKSLLRSLFNLAIENYAVSGRVLDIGSKSGAGSYYQHIKIDPGTEFVRTDIQERDGVTRLDVEQAFPFPDESFDVVLAFNLFEHVYDFHAAPKEIFRILNPGGRVIVATPFLQEYHADEDDYFRFTDSGLRRIWECAGFRCQRLEALGEGILTACATKLPYIAMPRFGRSLLSAFLYLCTTLLDRLISHRPRVDGKTVPERYALEHLAMFQKPCGDLVVDTRAMGAA